MNRKQLKKTQLYSEELGINLRKNKEEELFKWFLASILFGKRIGENIAKKTYLEFKKEKVLTPKTILKTKWKGLVKILDAGGYVRYDFSTATKLLEISKELLKKYGSKPLTKIHILSKDSKDLELKLIEFKGIGPVTVNIFLRELRPYWKKANPEPMSIVKKLAKKAKVKLNKKRKTIEFARIEAGLIRLRKEL